VPPPAAQAETAEAVADNPGDVISRPRGPRQPLWELGAFAVTASQPAYPGARQRVGSGIALPYFIYRGSVLRADQGLLGVRGLRTPTTEWDLGFAGSFGSSAGSGDARRGLPDIGTLVEFGPRLKWDLGTTAGNGRLGLSVPLRAVFDINNGFAYKGLSFEPALSWGRRTAGGWGYGLSASLLVGDSRLTDTFYGVAPVYATAMRPAYEARSGLIATRLGLNLNKRLSPDWRFFAFTRADTVKGAANQHSPLVDKPTGVSVGMGLSWTWKRSEALEQP
jgi:outer membrane scaffolding protein for murein synthesis (MipA/OmpV family)